MGSGNGNTLKFNLSLDAETVSVRLCLLLVFKKRSQLKKHPNNLNKKKLKIVFLGIIKNVCFIMTIITMHFDLEHGWPCSR